MATSVAVRERPILFSGAMVRAILDGRKTQTRRIRGLDLINHAPDAWDFADWGPTGAALFRLKGGDAIAPMTCPYGQPADRLWVRETWSAQYDFPSEYRGVRMTWYHDTPRAWRLPTNALRTYYRADRSMYDVCDLGEPLGIDLLRHHSSGEAPRWVPAIHMPHWASRLTLEITGVRVERLQAISHGDAYAEGCFTVPEALKQDAARQAAAEGRSECVGRDYFRALWDSINATRGYGWDVNPWVWVIEFRNISGAPAGSGRGA